MEVKIGNQFVGDGHPCYIIAEIGINHNGSIDIAKRLIQMAKENGADVVKFQKRTPERCVPQEQRNKFRDTPWGYISYMEYREKVEFWKDQYDEIDSCCEYLGISWTASCWDHESVEFIQEYNPPFHKIASACLTNDALLKIVKLQNKPVLLSTGMSTLEQIDHAVDILGKDNLILLHCVGTYPAYYIDLNLRMIPELKKRYGVPVGYSGHETGIPATIAAVALGACVVERHITCDRSMWGSDQASSLEPNGLEKLVKYIRTVEESLGDGVKKITSGEQEMIKRLRNS